jgi:hypothetical protein
MFLSSKKFPAGQALRGSGRCFAAPRLRLAFKEQEE